MSRINQECEKYVANGQYGRLYIINKKTVMDGTYAEIWVLPKHLDLSSTSITELSVRLKKHGVLVHGHIEGRVFGWIKQGKWIDDVNKVIENRKLDYDEDSTLSKDEVQAQKDLANEKLQKKLDNYTKDI